MKSVLKYLGCLMRLLQLLAQIEIGQCSLAVLDYFFKNTYSYLKHCSRAKLWVFLWGWVTGFFLLPINYFHMELLILDLKLSVSLR